MLSGVGAQPLHQEVLRLLRRAMRPGVAYIEIAVARAMNALGVGQTWQDMTASRAHTAVYTNTLDRPITAVATVRNTAGSIAMLCYFQINGTVPVGYQQAIASAAVNSLYLSASAVIPAGATYSLKVTNATLDAWSELR